MNEIETMNALKKGIEAYSKIVNKEIHYVFLKNKKYYELVFKAHKNNFMHLCGVTYIDPKTKQEYTPARFYDALKKNKLSPKGIRKKDDGTTELKLAVIEQLKLLTTCNIRIIDSRTTYLQLSFDKGIRSNQAIFCLGLENTIKGDYVPSTLLNLKTMKRASIKTGLPVHCVYSIDFYSSDINYICKKEEFVEYEKRHMYPYNYSLQEH